jgi:hypothetical protein
MDGRVCEQGAEENIVPRRDEVTGMEKTTY